MSIKWLEWNTIDPFKHVGGVEIHSICIAKELQKLGVEVEFSSNESDLFSNNTFDIVHTHGCSIPYSYHSRITTRKPFRMHTLHGTTFGNRAAQGKPFSVGGLKATLKEIQGCIAADIVVTIHKNISLAKMSKSLGKKVLFSSNGWDSCNLLDQNSLAFSSLSEPEVAAKISHLPPFWVFMGRGNDKVKATHRIVNALNNYPSLFLVAIPGEGFLPNHKQITPLGAMSPLQLTWVLKRSEGLILTSLYEGLPLVVLEALGLGCSVLSTKVGGLSTLPAQLQGLTWIESPNNAQELSAVMKSNIGKNTVELQVSRKQYNQQYLSTWHNIAQELLTCAKDNLLIKNGV